MIEHMPKISHALLARLAGAVELLSEHGIEPANISEVPAGVMGNNRTSVPPMTAIKPRLTPKGTIIPLIDEMAPEDVWSRFMDAWNRADIPGVAATLAPDIVVTGIGGCKGKPCRGVDEVMRYFVGVSLDHFFGMPRPTVIPENLRLPPCGPITISDVRSNGNQMDFYWVGEKFTPVEECGGDTSRGWITITVENGKITYLRNKYDLTDPGTIRIRAFSGETVFALQRPGSVATSDMRVIVSQHRCDEARSNVLIYAYCGRPDIEHEPLCAYIYQDRPNVVAFLLNDVVDSQAETVAPISIAELLAGGYGIAVRRQSDNVLIACGAIPTERGAL